MTINKLLYVIHVLAAMLLVAGIIGRQMTRREVQRASDLRTFKLFANLAGQFENLLVRPSSLGNVLAGVILAVRQGWPIFGLFEGASTNWLFVSNVLLIAMILDIVIIFIPRGKLYERALADADQIGEIMPALRASLEDPIVGAGTGLNLSPSWQLLFS